ncbi:MAG TPA: hypothetical protein VIK11_02815 [Tepidiformaceae bacterium]|jgi:hypothetical protein
MTTPRRTRRRNVPAASLPRPATGGMEEGLDARRASSIQVGHREHHVTTDYGYVHRDLITVACVGVVVIGFIVGMSFVL